LGGLEGFWVLEWARQRDETNLRCPGIQDHRVHTDRWTSLDLLG